jgi:hypothetical protein
MHKVYPRRGVVYTLRQILEDLDLDDGPSLGFNSEFGHAVIQNSHVTDAQLLSVPGLADTRWRYVRTTHEWIPVFEATDDAAVCACVDVSKDYDELMQCDDIWVTPKGFPRENPTVAIGNKWVREQRALRVETDLEFA